MAADVGENAIDIALKVARALTAVEADYFLGGSLASSLQGEPRATNDIDFVIALPLGKVGELAAALGPEFEVDIDTLRDAVLRASCANAFYLPFVTKIDFFGRGYEPFDESEFSRRRTTIVSATGESLVVKSPEDTVLRKLLWFRDTCHSKKLDRVGSSEAFSRHNLRLADIMDQSRQPRNFAYPVASHGRPPSPEEEAVQSLNQGVGPVGTP